MLSEDPYVIQAPAGPEPRFDPTELGEELPLEPADSPDVVPESMFFRETIAPVATKDRPVVVAGSVRQPGSDVAPVTPLHWFIETPGVHQGLAVAGGTGFGGDGYPLATYGIGFRSGTQTVEGSVVEGRMLYTVPLETSVVQIVTGSISYWQRPAGGYGAVSWGDTVDEPTSIIAYDTEGDQLGEWEVPPS